MNDAHESKKDLDDTDFDKTDLSDLGLDALRADWQSQPTNTHVDFEAAIRQQKKRKLWFYIDSVQALMLVVAGVFFLMQPASISTLIAAPVMFLGAIVIAYGVYNIHTRMMNYADWSPEGVLNFRCLSYRASIKHLRLNQVGCVIALGFTLTLLAIKTTTTLSIETQLIEGFLIASPCVILLFAYFQYKIKRYQVMLRQAESLKREFDQA